jgi:hypothetical protein
MKKCLRALRNDFYIDENWQSDIFIEVAENGHIKVMESAVRKELDYNFAAKRLSLSTQVTRNTQYTSYVPFYGVAPWKQQHLPPIVLVPMHPYHLNTPQYMPPTEL